MSVTLNVRDLKPGDFLAQIAGIPYSYFIYGFEKRERTYGLWFMMFDLNKGKLNLEYAIVEDYATQRTDCLIGHQNAR